MRTPTRWAALAAAVPLLFGAVVGTVPAVNAASTSSVPPLPECRYDDVLTPYRAYRDWRKTLLDPIYMVPRSYVPPNLVSVREANISGRGKVRPLVLTDLRALAAAARAAGKPLAIQSAYRSYARQETIFANNVEQYGFKYAALVSARPGHSEHQLGTALDFKSKGGPAPWELKDWATTPAGKWMKNNGWKYGFVMSYPYGKRSVTCYKYESWHYRYFGREVARAITESGLTTREWLWRQGYGIQPTADTTPPSVPANLTGEALGERRVRLTWSASTDDRDGLIRYRVFRDDVRIATVTDTFFTDRPAAEGAYRYKLRAVDAAGNKSAFTPSITVEAVEVLQP